MCAGSEEEGLEERYVTVCEREVRCWPLLLLFVCVWGRGEQSADLFEQKRGGGNWRRGAQIEERSILCYLYSHGIGPGREREEEKTSWRERCRSWRQGGREI